MLLNDPHIIIHSWTELRMWSIQRGDRIRWNDWKIPTNTHKKMRFGMPWRFLLLHCYLPLAFPKKLSSISKFLDDDADGIKILQEFRPKFQLEKQMALCIHKAWLLLKLWYCNVITFLICELDTSETECTKKVYLAYYSLNTDFYSKN